MLMCPLPSRVIELILFHHVVDEGFDHYLRVFAIALYHSTRLMTLLIQKDAIGRTKCQLLHVRNPGQNFGY